MGGQLMAKRERVIEAVRHGLEGDAALEFIHNSGYAMSVPGVAKHLRSMGGRAKVQALITQGLSNHDILAECFPQDDLSGLPEPEPTQGDLFDPEEGTQSDAYLAHHPDEQFETTKLTMRIPRDVYTALRIASRVEGKPQNQLIVEILSTALARMPGFGSEDDTQRG
jgi:hypothetical protein